MMGNEGGANSARPRRTWQAGTLHTSGQWKQTALVVIHCHVPAVRGKKNAKKPILFKNVLMKQWKVVI